MKRRLFTVISILSLVLCVATVAAWVRSYWYQSEIGCYTPGVPLLLGLAANDGRLIIVANTYPQKTWPAQFYAYADARAFPQSAQAKGWIESGYYAYDALGFGIAYPSAKSPSRPSGLRRYVAVAPLWFITALFALFPAIKLRSILRRRPKPGCCPSCGYDMRATPDRCPECGTSPAPSPVGHC